MSLPSPLLSVPGLMNDQMYFNGVTLGAYTPFELVKVEGIAKAKLRSGNTSRPRTRGSFPGLNLLDTRTITATMDIGGTAADFGSYVNLGGALAALRTACANEGTNEFPLWIQLPNLPLVACMARVIAFDPPYDVIADLGSLMKAVPLQFEATDPYFYAAPTASTTVELPTPVGGFHFPLTFPWSFGGASSGNQKTIVNAGDVSCWPVLVLNGPCLNPTISNESLSGNPGLSFNTQLQAGDQLVVDCDMQSVIFYPAGSTVGAPVPQLVDAGSTFFALTPGSNIIAFNSQDTAPAAGFCSVWATSTYDGLL